MPFALAALAIVLALILVSELGFRLGTSARRRYDGPRRSSVSTVQAATLGLLALVLGFVMSMAETRFNGRRKLLVDEANAIHTTYLRAAFLPEPHRSQTHALLRQYVAARRAYFRATSTQAPTEVARSHALVVQLWRPAAIDGQTHPNWDVLSTYIESLNDTIKLAAMRDLAITARLPGVIHLLLAFVALTALGISGFSTALSGARSMLSLLVLPVLIGVAIAVIVDLDRSRFGLISTGDRPMIRVEQALANESR